MYSRLLTRVCERSSYRALTDIRTTQVSRLSHVAVKNEEPTAEIVSAKFPDFKVIYTLPRIQLASAVNKMKRHFTILASLTVPAVYALHNAEILSTNISIATVATGKIPFTTNFGFNYLERHQLQVMLHSNILQVIV